VSFLKYGYAIYNVEKIGSNLHGIPEILIQNSFFHQVVGMLRIFYSNNKFNKAQATNQYA
jgi:hypothetical protein